MKVSIKAIKLSFELGELEVEGNDLDVKAAIEDLLRFKKRVEDAAEKISNVLGSKENQQSKDA